jgi:hypothetical protein
MADPKPHLAARLAAVAQLAGILKGRGVEALSGL